MKKLLAILAFTLPMTVLANGNLPFVGKKQFWSYCISGMGYTHYLEIKKNGNAKIYTVSNKTNRVGMVEYQGKYRTVMEDSEGRYFKVLNRRQIALTDSQGNIDYDSCGEEAVMRLQ
ncbi:hypothetical protein [Moraxella nasicaprae]|uniref:C-type lysozyme inhibitor domain-containing protein n=1 Tax=Moraxella nasicaprae TaxID=2904122 RepID=A0ABY6F6P4_9GAMM|nr:hypothetical protein [Moraxella nasicaprae]UXZ05760.1 hypothetical protein LU297_04855 [Moraxella nasicaprae]